MKYGFLLFLVSVVYLVTICIWSELSPMTYHDYGLFLALAVLAVQFILLGFFVFTKD